MKCSIQVALCRIKTHMGSYLGRVGPEDSSVIMVRMSANSVDDPTAKRGLGPLIGLDIRTP